MKKLIVLIVFIIIGNFSEGQEWIRVFGPPNTGKGFAITEAYDHGYLIGGHLRHTNYYWYYGWLIKTDINGELLWDIKFGDVTGSDGTLILDVDNTVDGGIIICGITFPFDNKDGFVMKLDECGQKEWCKIYKTWTPQDAIVKIKGLSDGGYIMYFAYWGNDLANKRIWLFKLDESGNTVWQNLYATDTSYMNEHAHEMIIAPDSGYLLTGYNWVEIDTMPGYYYEHPFFIKVKKDGEPDWENNYWPEQGFGSGEAQSSIYDVNGNIYASG